MFPYVWSASDRSWTVVRIHLVILVVSATGKYDFQMLKQKHNGFSLTVLKLGSKDMSA